MNAKRRLIEAALRFGAVTLHIRGRGPGITLDWNGDVPFELNDLGFKTTVVQGPFAVPVSIRWEDVESYVGTDQKAHNLKGIR